MAGDAFQNNLVAVIMKNLLPISFKCCPVAPAGQNEAFLYFHKPPLSLFLF